MELTLKKEEHLNYIIDHFDFDKVHNVMIYLDWKWYCYSPDGTGFGMFIPSKLELIKTATGLLNDIYDSDFESSSTGGFKAIKHDDYLELQFTINDISSDPINHDNPKYELLKKQKTRKNKITKINIDENN